MYRKRAARHQVLPFGTHLLTAPGLDLIDSPNDRSNLRKVLSLRGSPMGWHVRCNCLISVRTEAAMLETIPAPKTPRNGFSASNLNRLQRQDFTRDARLADASIAGVVLSF